MKKTLLALAVMTAAGAVSAAEVAKIGNMSLSTDGDFEIALELKETDGDMAVTYDNAEIAFTGESVINEDVSAFLEYGLEMQRGDTVISKDIAAGFKGGWGTVTFGKTGHVLDLGSSESKNIGADISNDDLPSSDDIIKYESANDGVNFGASYNFDVANDQAGSGFSAYVSGDVSGVSLRGDFGTTGDINIYGVKGSYTGDAFSIGAAYAGSDGALEPTIIDGWVGFSAGLDWKLGVQTGSRGDVDAMAYYLNTSYDLNDVVGFYGEVGALDSDAYADGGFGASVGMTMAF
jgi:predicted porin